MEINDNSQINLSQVSGPRPQSKLPQIKNDFDNTESLDMDMEKVFSQFN